MQLRAFYDSFIPSFYLPFGNPNQKLLNLYNRDLREKACAGHSFAVNILNNGANIKTVSRLLGHSGLKHTEKYTRAIDSLKVEAINSLPDFEL